MRQLAWMTLAGCGRVPLPEVPIIGGNEFQRQAARDELDAFERAVTQGRLELVEVRFEAMEDQGGYYHPRREEIALLEDLHQQNVPRILRHELCHALDYQNRMLVDPVPVLDVWADHILSDESLIERDLVPDNARDARGEVMAKFCEEGSSSSLLMSTGCTPSGERLHAVGSWLMEQVWHGDSEFADTSTWTVTDIRGSWAHPASADIYTVDVLGARSQDAAWMQFGKAGVWDEVLLDLRTGEALEELTSDTPRDPVVAPIPPLPAGLQLPGIYEAGGTGARHVTDGETAVALVQGGVLEAFDTVLSQRVLVHDGDGPWSIVGGLCLPDAPSSVFLANGRFYFAWAEDGEIRWSEVVRTHGD